MTVKEYLEQHGISPETAEKFGLEDLGDRLKIPIRDSDGKVIFNKYRHMEVFEGKKFSYDPGSEASLFNIEAISQSNTVFIVEGEPDAIRLDQEGITAVSSTSGAGTFKEEWTQYFASKKVFIVYDNDDSGKEGALKVQALIPHAYILTLPDDVKDICEYFFKYTKIDLAAQVKKIKEENTIGYKDLIAVIDKWLLLPDKNVLKVITAALVAHKFSGDPLWVLLIAPPSGTKTELISAIAGIPFVYFLSDLTAQTFASGLNYKVDPSLLATLKHEVLVMKDFTTVLSMRQEERTMILSQLREIYDGRYTKNFGTGKRVEWEGKLGFIAGVTTIVDTHLSLYQTMGERFIQYRIPQPNDEDVAIMALENAGREQEMRTEIRTAVTKYFNGINIPKVTEIDLPRDILLALSALASFIVKARSGILRDRYSREVEYVPAPEAPARFSKQLGTLIKALAVVDNRKKVTWDDFFLVLKVGFDAIARNRMDHIIVLCNQTELSTTQVSQATNFSTAGSQRILEDLTALSILSVNKRGQGQANLWKISSKTKSYFNKFLPKISLEDLSEIFPETDYYYPLIKEILNTGEYTDYEKVEMTDEDTQSKEDTWTEPPQGI